MNDAPLPSQIDVRKLVVKGIEISAKTPVSSLPRFVSLLADDKGVVAVNLRFYKDEQRFKRIDGQLKVAVNVSCQRCLEPLALDVESHFELAIVWSEEESERLPKSLDPLIVGEELVDLNDVISEELVLSLPFVSYHQADECKQVVGYSCVDPDAVEETVVEDEKENPFNILQQLKKDS